MIILRQESFLERWDTRKKIRLVGYSWLVVYVLPRCMFLFRKAWFRCTRWLSASVFTTYDFSMQVPLFDVLFFCKGATLITCPISISGRIWEEWSWYHFAFCLFSLRIWSTFSGILGYSRLVVWQDINLCTGLELSDSVHVGVSLINQG